MEKLLGADSLQPFVASIFIANGSMPAEAEQVAANLVLANLSGHDSHGVGMLPRYVDAVAEGGLVPGAGTLSDELLRRTGFANLSAGYGLKQWDILPLEYLVARPPRVLLSVGQAETGEDRMTSHPALARLASGIDVAGYPDRLINCGGPTIIDAMARLRAIRASVPA